MMISFLAEDEDDPPPMLGPPLVDNNR